MTLHHVLAAGALSLVAVLHSILGETRIVGPLLADDRWEVGMPRHAVGRIIRFAWHVTTIAWLGLAAAALGVDGTLTLMAVALASAALVIVLLPTHLSWPLFLLAALWSGVAAGIVRAPLLTAFAVMAAVLAGAAGVLHLTWSAGMGLRAARAALPTRRDGTARFEPSRLATAGVALALGVFSTALVALSLDPGSMPARVVVGGATLVLAARAIGDGRYLGFTKRVRSTPFGRRDDAVFTPLVVVLMLGGTAALAL